MSRIETDFERISEEMQNRFHNEYKISHLHLMAVKDALALNIIFERDADLEDFERNTGGMKDRLTDRVRAEVENTLEGGGFNLVVEADSLEAENRRQKQRGGGTVPSVEEFAAAEAAMVDDDRGLDEVCERIKQRFRSKGVREVFVLYSPNTRGFYPYVFYEKDRHIKQCEEAGVATRIREAILDELARVGRGERGSLVVQAEFDSHENVVKNFGGDYFERLR